MMLPIWIITSPVHDPITRKLREQAEAKEAALTEEGASTVTGSNFKSARRVPMEMGDDVSSVGSLSPTVIPNPLVSERVGPLPLTAHTGSNEVERGDSRRSLLFKAGPLPHARASPGSDDIVTARNQAHAFHDGRCHLARVYDDVSIPSQESLSASASAIPDAFPMRSG